MIPIDHSSVRFPSDARITANPDITRFSGWRSMTYHSNVVEKRSTQLISFLRKRSMSQRTKLIAVSASVGALITLAGGILVSYPPVERIASIVLLPVALCQYITGPGPRLGQHGHEGTPVQLVAAIVGIGMAWAIYSSIFFFAESFRRRHISGQR